jgi:hypothetical protein
VAPVAQAELTKTVTSTMTIIVAGTPWSRSRHFRGLRLDFALRAFGTSAVYPKHFEEASRTTVRYDLLKNRLKFSMLLI